MSSSSSSSSSSFSVVVVSLTTWLALWTTTTRPLPADSFAPSWCAPRHRRRRRAGDLVAPLRGVGWTPPTRVVDDDDVRRRRDPEREAEAIALCAARVERFLNGTLEDDDDEDEKDEDEERRRSRRRAFLHLTEHLEGERALERVSANADTDAALRSLCAYGMSCGETGSPTRLERSVAHLTTENGLSGDPDESESRRIKYDRDATAAVALLAELRRKRSPRGALDLLVELGAWGEHENLPLLRSGVPTRATSAERRAAEEAARSTHDPDALLSIRRDLRHLRVYTIDGSDAHEIDDGLSVEVLENGAYRYWIHIADADRWAPRGSDAWRRARGRTASVYLPDRAIPMFPPLLSDDVMSLRPRETRCALSMGVELDDDGRAVAETIAVVPSLVEVAYRLTYDEVDEMLEEGVGRNEEWALGALSDAAESRRRYRTARGCTEARVARPIPRCDVRVTTDDGGRRSIEVEVDDGPEHRPSVAHRLVMEMMILSGEAMGKWGVATNERRAGEDRVELSYRSQREPDHHGREAEVAELRALEESNAGNGWCADWYSRRFMEPARVSKKPGAHFGLGLDCYVQWSSPIRRFSDLQVHAAVKRYLRRERVDELLAAGEPVPVGVTARDLGRDLPDDPDEHPVNYDDGAGSFRAVRPLQRRTEEYWILEKLRRRRASTRGDGDEPLEAVVLGLVDARRSLYAVYLYGLGVEKRYASEVGELVPGQRLRLVVADANPREGVLSLRIAPPDRTRTKRRRGRTSDDGATADRAA